MAHAPRYRSAYGRWMQPPHHRQAKRPTRVCDNHRNAPPTFLSARPSRPPRRGAGHSRPGTTVDSTERSRNGAAGRVRPSLVQADAIAGHATDRRTDNAARWTPTSRGRSSRIRTGAPRPDPKLYGGRLRKPQRPADWRARPCGRRQRYRPARGRGAPRTLPLRARPARATVPCPCSASVPDAS